MGFGKLSTLSFLGITTCFLILAIKFQTTEEFTMAVITWFSVVFPLV